MFYAYIFIQGAHGFSLHRVYWVIIKLSSLCQYLDSSHSSIDKNRDLHGRLFAFLGVYHMHMSLHTIDYLGQSKKNQYDTTYFWT